jgi:hypothetical protein
MLEMYLIGRTVFQSGIKKLSFPVETLSLAGAVGPIGKSVKSISVYINRFQLPAERLPKQGRMIVVAWQYQHRYGKGGEDSFKLKIIFTDSLFPPTEIIVIVETSLHHPSGHVQQIPGQGDYIYPLTFQAVQKLPQTRQQFPAPPFWQGRRPRERMVDVQIGYMGDGNGTCRHSGNSLSDEEFLHFIPNVKIYMVLYLYSEYRRQESGQAVAKLKRKSIFIKF